MNAFPSDAGLAHSAARKRTALTLVFASVAVHAFIGIGAGFWIVARYFTPEPAKFELKRDLRIAAEEREHRMNMAEFDGLTPKPTFNDKLASLRPTAFALPELPKIPLDQMLPLDACALVSDQVASLVGTAGLGADGIGAAGSGGTGSALSFFGIRDKGRSVVIMIDVSDSMFTRTGDAGNASGRRTRLIRKGESQHFHAIRKEAVNLVRSLSINSRFGVIRWSGGAYSWQPALVASTDQNKEAATRHILDEIDFGTAKPKEGRPGGTRHDYALEEAFALQPEVIYMLTDGNATAAQPAGGLRPIDPQAIFDVAKKGQSALAAKARIHTIYYVTGRPNDEERRMLRTLSSRNDGQFREIRAPGARGD